MADFPPLARRVYGSSRSVHCRLPITSSALRPFQYRQWSDEQMNRAYETYQTSNQSIRRIAEIYNVPKSTLQDRICGRVLPGSKSGKSRYLDDAEEKDLVDWLLKCAEIGFPRNRQDVLGLVQNILDNRHVDKVVTHGWWERFSQRHPELALRTPSALSYARMKGTSIEALTVYCDTLEKTMRENNLTDMPGSVFNMDESGMPLDPKSTKCIAKKGMKDPSHISYGDKSHITVVGCISAAGFSIPPMILFDRKTLHADMTQDEVPGTYYGLNSGWMTQDLFQEWLQYHFLKYAPSVRPILLLLDGHSSHYNPDAIRFAAKEQIILFTLPPHTTHISQPLDRGCFGPLKLYWRAACHDYLKDNPGKVINRFSFNGVFSVAYKKAMTMDNLISAFSVTGVFPFNRSKLLCHHSVQESTPSKATTGIAYIPLFPNESPLTRRSKSIGKVSVVPTPHSSVQHMFKPPPAQIYRHRASSFKGSVHSLTSGENLRLIDEKQKKKEEAERLKQERKEIREQKRRDKEQALREKREKKLLSSKKSTINSQEKGNIMEQLSENEVSSDTDSTRSLFRSFSGVNVLSPGHRSSRPRKMSVKLQDSILVSLSDSESSSENPLLKSWISDLGLSIGDENAILCGDWLSANHMSAANSLLKAQFPAQNGLQDTCVLEKNHLWLSSCDEFVQLIFVASGHWACLSNKFSPAGSVDLFDSLLTIPKEGKSIMQQACCILKCTDSTFNINVVHVGMQSGLDDCGLYAIAMACDLCNNVDPVTRKYYQSDMRNHLHSCFNNKLLMQFPSTENRVSKRVLVSETVSIYCVCRMPELSKRMVCCDQCEVWFHEGCVPIPTEVIFDANDEIPWQCPQCKVLTSADNKHVNAKKATNESNSTKGSVSTSLKSGELNNVSPNPMCCKSSAACDVTSKRTTKSTYKTKTGSVSTSLKSGELNNVSPNPVYHKSSAACDVTSKKATRSTCKSLSKKTGSVSTSLKSGELNNVSPNPVCCKSSAACNVTSKRTTRSTSKTKMGSVSTSLKSGELNNVSPNPVCCKSSAACDVTSRRTTRSTSKTKTGAMNKPKKPGSD